MIPAAMTSAVGSEQKPDSVFLEKCIREIAEGSRDAMASLYQNTGTAVYGYALSVVKNTGDAEDVTQNVYVSVYRSASAYRPGGKPMAWILTIAKNNALMKIRERQKYTVLPDDGWDEPAAPDRTASAENRIVLDLAMRELSDTDRQIVMLHAVSGCRHREIANLLGLPLSTVLSKYRRALKRLEKILKEE